MLLLLLLLAHIAHFVALHGAIKVRYRFISPMMPYMILLDGLPVYVCHSWPYGSSGVSSRSGESPVQRIWTRHHLRAGLLPPAAKASAIFTAREEVSA